MSRVKDSISRVVTQASRWAKSLGVLRIIDAAFCESLLFLNRNRRLFGKHSRLIASIAAIGGALLGFGLPRPWNLLAIAVCALATVQIIVTDLIGETSSAPADGESPAEHIRNALCVLELGSIPIIDRHQVDLVIVPRDHWEAAQARLWRAVYQLEGRPPTRNQSTKKRLAEIDGARDRERLTLLASREA